MTGIYRLAGLTIGIESVFDEVYKLCNDYRANGGEPPALMVVTGAEDIAAEREKAEKEAAYEGVPPRQHSDAYMETLAAYRKIAERLPAYDRMLFHGSAVAVNGLCYLFTAKSGTGKSTHTRLWREMLGEAVVMVNDDKPVLQVSKEGTTVHGTPWDGKHRLSSNVAVPLRAICILERSENNWIREIEKTEAMPILLQQTYRPADPVALTRTLQLLNQLNVKFFRMGCNMDPDAAALSYRAMKGREI